MSYWEDDAKFLREVATTTDPTSYTTRRLNEIADDMDRAAPDAAFLEELAGKIEHWSMERVAPTAEFSEELGEQLRLIALALQKDPSQ